MQFNRTFHQTGTELTEREVTSQSEYPGTIIRREGFTFNPNPLQPNSLMMHTNTNA